MEVRGKGTFHNFKIRRRRTDVTLVKKNKRFNSFISLVQQDVKSKNEIGTDTDPLKAFSSLGTDRRVD